jgi:hypothetical protein
MQISIPIAQFNSLATGAALVSGTDYVASDKGSFLNVLALSMKGLRFLYWETATNGQPGLNLGALPLTDLLILLLNIQAGAAGKGTAWTQT